MSTNLQLLIGRVLLSIIFIMAGISKLGGVDGTAGYMASMGIPLPGLPVWLVIALEILGGFAILLGFFTRYAAHIFTSDEFGMNQLTGAALKAACVDARNSAAGLDNFSPD